LAVNNVVRIGIIGCGALGAVHARRLSEMEGVAITAVSDPNPEAMARVAGPLGASTMSEQDYHELLKSGLDAVCIASPDSFHVAQILDALDAGLHVLCEKPLTLEPTELQAVVDRRDRTGLHVSMTYPRRYGGGIRAMRNEFLSGQWGAIKMITAYNTEDWLTPNIGQWRHDPKLCPGGFLHDANGHQIDTILWAGGLDVESVFAEVENRGTPVPIVIWGSARLTGGIPMSFTFVGDGHLWREQVNFHCEKRDFVMDNGRTLWNVDGKLVPVAPDERWESSDAAFIRLIRGEGPNWSPPEEFWPVLRFTRAALESGARRVPVTVPPR